ncbi:hypothetical protein KO561_05415 [Radiobacillus kanasensis]|uniref:hypothetical protein n=1 Tax=Radiobacillus kanasensis TaxID=2844358 RepID=UPI001E5064DF|nr:hypothetical protein [Radiobacillus kanasensis]UFU00386.1 hypothetical protein KO561_05415 [Radiobacillus kanasensis]
MKLRKRIGLLALLIVLFLAGYWTGHLHNKEAFREIRIGYQNADNPNRIDYKMVFTDTENQSIVDNFLMIYIHKEKVGNVNIDVDNPDIYFEMGSPKQSVRLINSRMWFTEDGAVIGERKGENWDQVEYFRIDKSDADYMKEKIDYQ